MSDGHPHERPGPPPIGVLAWLYLVVLWLTWTPTGDHGTRVLWVPYAGWKILLGNLLLFAPLGFVLAVHWAWRMRPLGRAEVRRVVLRSAGAVALLSATVELGQIRVPGRWLSWWDLVMNTLGAALAAWVAARFVRSGIREGGLMASGSGVVFVGVLLFVTATGFTASRGFALAGWNEAYTVHAGDEATGDRTYDGSVVEPRICANTPEGVFCAEPGAGARERRDLRGQALEYQSVRISAVVTSAGPQSVDARIVTFSLDGRHRNATLHQNGRDLLLRLRTPIGGPNGTGREFVLGGAVPDGVPTTVTGSLESGRIRLSAEHDAGRLRGDFLVGFFSGWWLVRPLPDRRIEAGVLRRASLVAAAAFSLPLGLGAVLLGWGPAVLRLAGGALSAPLFLFLLGSVLDVPVFPWGLAVASGFGLLGAGLGLIGRPESAP